MPYLRQPKWAKVAERSIFIAIYALLLANGLLYWYMAPHGWIGLVVAISALSCVFGSATGYFRFEWIGLSPLATFMLIGMIAVHAHLTTYALFFITIVALTLIRRFIHLTLIARALRHAD